MVGRQPDSALYQLNISARCMTNGKAATTNGIAIQPAGEPATTPKQQVGDDPASSESGCLLGITHPGGVRSGRADGNGERKRRVIWKSAWNSSRPVNR